MWCFNAKIFAGVDNITAEGTEAIDNVTDVLKTLGDIGVKSAYNFLEFGGIFVLVQDLLT